MKRPLNRAFQDAVWVDTPAIRNAGRRTVDDLLLGLAPGPDRIDRYGLGAADEQRRSFARPSAGWAQPGTKVAALLGEEDIVLGLPAKGKRSALARIAAWLGEKVDMGQGPVLAAMLRRERLGSTAIGYGMAIPHARLEGIPAPKAMLATLQRPVWFDAPDEHPVDLLLAVLWPKHDSVGFLQALAHFCRFLRHPELRDRIRASETPAEARAWIEFFEERTTEPSGGNPFRAGHSRFPGLLREARA